MPSTFTPIDREVLAALKKGDERALERLFRDRVAAMTEDAQRDLGADAASAAPKVVHSVILRLWADRASFETPEAVETYLREAVHDGALRERKRRATLQRIEAREGVKRAAHGATAGGTPSVDEAWNQIVTALHAPPPDAEATARAAANAMRHETAGHIAGLAPKKSWKTPVLAGLAFIVIAGGAFWWLETSTAKAVVDNQLQSPDARDIKTIPGQMGNLTLDDGSTVKLGPASVIRLVPRFGSPLRGVSIDGTAQFAVAAGQEQPFELRAKNVAVSVKGTVFDVRAYKEEPTVTVRVKEGQVDLKVGKNVRPLAAGQAVSIASDGTITDTPAQALTEQLGWLDGTLVLTNMPMKSVLAEVKKWYGIDLFVRDSAAMTTSINMTAPLQSSKDAITAIAKASGLEFGYEGTNMVLKAPAKGKRK